jgi:hypothetical protein
VMKCMNSDQEPSLDGFTMAFFQTCWDVIKDDVMRVFHVFHARSKFEKVLMLLSLLSFRRNPGLLMLRIFNLLV